MMRGMRRGASSIAPGPPQSGAYDFFSFDDAAPDWPGGLLQHGVHACVRPDAGGAVARVQRDHGRCRCSNCRVCRRLRCAATGVWPVGRPAGQGARHRGCHVGLRSVQRHHGAGAHVYRAGGVACGHGGGGGRDHSAVDGVDWRPGGVRAAARNPGAADGGHRHRDDGGAVVWRLCHRNAGLAHGPGGAGGDVCCGGGVAVQACAGCWCAAGPSGCGRWGGVLVGRLPGGYCGAAAHCACALGADRGGH
ncbi:hypothetical protein D3C72_1457670 [compost metagenome]